ncbi:serine/arginine repetitive matrix protein 1-like [Frankliniella occidentalis]|uniref:Serine/arginine repetitive matrix protein 1-like n=1 Tax=Frankliniella occidentalis TaxID=133901 RepID=A0A9C6U0Y2_FRAOC|nr:serine/arginine repetitive matrix protein 1-like [Frankliniella occidentalis]
MPPVPPPARRTFMARLSPPGPFTASFTPSSCHGVDQRLDGDPRSSRIRYRSSRAAQTEDDDVVYPGPAALLPTRHPGAHRAERHAAQRHRVAPAPTPAAPKESSSGSDSSSPSDAASLWSRARTTPTHHVVERELRTKRLVKTAGHGRPVESLPSTRPGLTPHTEARLLRTPKRRNDCDDSVGLPSRTRDFPAAHRRTAPSGGRGRSPSRRVAVDLNASSSETDCLAVPSRHTPPPSSASSRRSSRSASESASGPGSETRSHRHRHRHHVAVSSSESPWVEDRERHRHSDHAAATAKLFEHSSTSSRHHRRRPQGHSENEWHSGGHSSRHSSGHSSRHSSENSTRHSSRHSNGQSQRQSSRSTDNEGGAERRRTNRRLDRETEAGHSERLAADRHADREDAGQHQQRRADRNLEWEATAQRQRRVDVGGRTHRGEAPEAREVRRRSGHQHSRERAEDAGAATPPRPRDGHLRHARDRERERDPPLRRRLTPIPEAADDRDRPHSSRDDSQFRHRRR